MGKPTVKLTGTDGNAFAIIGKVRRALIDAGMMDETDRYMAEAMRGDYDNMLRVTMEYVDVE